MESDDVNESTEYDSITVANRLRDILDFRGISRIWTKEGNKRRGHSVQGLAMGFPDFGLFLLHMI